MTFCARSGRQQCLSSAARALSPPCGGEGRCPRSPPGACARGGGRKRLRGAWARQSWKAAQGGRAAFGGSKGGSSVRGEACGGGGVRGSRRARGAIAVHLPRVVAEIRLLRRCRSGRGSWRERSRRRAPLGGDRCCRPGTAGRRRCRCRPARLRGSTQDGPSAFVGLLSILIAVTNHAGPLAGRRRRCIIAQRGLVQERFDSFMRREMITFAGKNRRALHLLDPITVQPFLQLVLTNTSTCLGVHQDLHLMQQFRIF